MTESAAPAGHRIGASRALAMAALALLIVASNGWHAAAPVFEHSLSLIGWSLVAIGVSGRIWSGSYVCGRKHERLVTLGPYSMCRNPLYFFMFLGGLGITLISKTIVLPLAFAFVFCAYYPGVIRREEATLLARYGFAFEAYRARVPRFWPSLRIYSEPEHYLISTAKFRKLLEESTWFGVVAGSIDFLEALHTAGYLPTMVTLY